MVTAFHAPKQHLNFMRKLSPLLRICKSKVKYNRPTTRQDGAWRERRYSSYSFLTSALDGGEWSPSHLGRALPPGKGPPVPIVQEAG
jgi:hypothetical protein